MVIKLTFPEIKGTWVAPPAKSTLIRYIFLCMQIDEYFEILNLNLCEDVLTAINIAKTWGAEVKINDNLLRIKGRNEPLNNKFNCGESALCMRMLTCILSRYNKEFTIRGTGTLNKRPIGEVIESLSNNGILLQSNKGYLPITIKGPIKNNVFFFQNLTTSQSITGLLYSLPFLFEESYLTLKNPVSNLHIIHSIEILKKFGVKIQYKGDTIIIGKFDKTNIKTNKLIADGDWSIASIFIASAMANGNLKIFNLDLNSHQAEKEFLKFLNEKKYNFNVTKNYIEISKQPIDYFEYDIKDAPDIFFPLIILSANANNICKIEGINRLLNKESNRLESIMKEISKINIKSWIIENSLYIDASKKDFKKIIFYNTYSDHRIAMCLTLLNAGNKNYFYLDNKECVKKSYPLFFDEVKKIGALF
ncbi:MAG: hypothetical protein N3A01_05820 [Bacteroidales bacterium]|nr:hypothetical protein [Bacteroidales bacterium]